MPEGDTIFRTARTLHRALAGRRVTRFESVFPALTRVHEDRPITGRAVESVTSRGKHLLMAFSGDLVLHTHMRMNGSWHVYRPGERWQRARRDMRILVATEAIVAVAFTVPVAAFLTTRDLERHEQLRQLGPDLATEPSDRAEILRRIRTLGGDAIGVLKSEILFVSRIDPFTPAAELSDAALDRLLDAARRLFVMNIADESTSPGRFVGRHTTGSLDPSAKLWVYGRGGKPCRQCGTEIEAKKTGLDARLTYWCPVCQQKS